MIKWLLILVVIFTGCIESNVHKKNTGEVFSLMELEIYVIDSCEYIGYLYGSHSWASHRGRCKFCAERAKNNCK